jgi:Spy/CpxP family protein refolding chaperone
MKKGILISLLLAGLSYGAFAQDTKSNNKQRPPHERKAQADRFTAEERAEIYAKRMQKSLGLTDEQYKKVLTINIEQTKQREAFREAQKAQMQANREKMKAEHEAISKKYEAVLTPDQMKKLKEQQDQRKADFKERRGGRK